jgi:hypothetical protein
LERGLSAGDLKLEGNVCFRPEADTSAPNYLVDLQGKEMVTPEFVSEENGEFVFVACHNVMAGENVAVSIEFNRARILNARKHLPASLARCRLIYDVRGQMPPDAVLSRIGDALSDVCKVEFMR